MNTFDISFAVIAFREAEFYSNIAQYLKEKKGINSAFLTFYEPADRYLANKGHRVFSLHKELKKTTYKYRKDRERIARKKYGLNSLNDLLFHEAHTFCRFNEEKLISKLLDYDIFFEKLLSENKFSLICQELGGFIAPLSLYYNAKFKNIDHVFFEPSFFKGYLFFDKNTLDAGIDLSVGISEKDINNVKEYIRGYLKNKPVAIPEKDKHHFKDANLKKIINKRNIMQLSKKIFYKYIMREKEEYDAIFNHVKQNILRLFRRLALSKHYYIPDFSVKYAYFPLHVPIDFALTVRQNGLYDQLSLIEKVAKTIPVDKTLYIKEHPAAIGAYNVKKLKSLINNYRIKLVHPKINSYDLIKNSEYVLTINSKVGIEALMQGKPVYALGHSYYSSAKGVTVVTEINDLKNISVDGSLHAVDYAFFAKVYRSSFKGELYNNNEENIKSFSDNLAKFI